MSKNNRREAARRDPKRFGSMDVGVEFGKMLSFIMAKCPSLTVRQAAEYVYENLDNIVASGEYQKYTQQSTYVDIKPLSSYPQNKGCTKRTPKK